MIERYGARLRWVLAPVRSLLVAIIAVACAMPAFADGLPGEYLLSSRWRAVLTPYSPLPNAAFLTEADYVSIRGALARTINEYNKMELGVTVPIGLYQSAGATWFKMGTASYESVEDFQSTGARIDPSNDFFMLSYAINPWRRLSVGVNVNLIYESLWQEDNRLGVGIDLGLTYRLLNHPVLGNHLAGIAMGNLVPPNLGTTIDTAGIPDERTATSLKLTLLSNYWGSRISTGVDFSLKDLYSSTDDFATSGIDASKTLEWDLDVSVSVWVLRLIKLYGLIGFSNTGLEYGGFALGFNLPSVNAGRDLSFLYQMVSVAEGEASTHSAFLRGEVGKHREEMYAKRMARLLNLDPNNLYNRALTLYSAGQYWDAFYVFGEINVEYPDFFKRDWVTYYMASCLENLDMRRASTSDYIGALREYPRSTIKPYADLGLMRLYYREGDFASVSSQLTRLTQPEVPDSIKMHAYYLMGQTYVQTGEYRKARQVFELIPQSHPEYLFAQHSLAIVNVISGTTDAAVENLRAAVNAQPRSKGQSEIINRSLLMLGYIYYEMSPDEGTLSQAVTALRSVAKNSYYREDALLGLGWTAIRARQWQDCIEAGQELQTITKRPPLIAEGALIRAYAFMMQRNYMQAVTLLTEASNTLAAYDSLTQEDVRARKGLYENGRIDYDEVAREAQRLAQSRQSDHVRGLVNALGARQQQSKVTIDEHLKYFDEFKRETFFARGTAAIQEDVEYALAVSRKLSGGKDLQEKAIQTQQKQRQLDEEIQKLKSEMDKLESAPADTGKVE